MTRIEVSSSAPPYADEPDHPELPGSGLRTSRVDHWDSLSDIAPAWADLVNRAPSSSIFQTFQWHSCWWKAFGDRHKLLVILCHRKEKLVGIAPLMVAQDVDPHRHNRKQIRFIGCTNKSSDYLDFIIDPDVPEALDAVLAEIIVSLPKVDRVYLSHFPTHFDNYSRTIAYLRKYTSKVVAELDQEAPCRILGCKQHDLQVANKSSLRRRYNYFNKSGDLRFQQCSSESEILLYLDDFFAQHMSRRDLTDSPSQFRDLAERSFYRDLVCKMFPLGWLRFDAVFFNGKPIAFHFGFVYRNKFIWYKPTFDVEYRKKSPGEVLIKFLLEDAIDRDLDEFDFTVGSEPFKYRFSNSIRRNNRLILFRSFADYWMYRLKTALRVLLGWARPTEDRTDARFANRPQ